MTEANSNFNGKYKFWIHEYIYIYICIYIYIYIVMETMCLSNCTQNYITIDVIILLTIHILFDFDLIFHLNLN